MENKINYAIYARKSSESEDRQALSIESQLRELKDYAAKNDLHIAEVYQESQSAFKVGRPIFAKVIDLIEEGAVNGLLCWKIDRLARNARDGGRVIQAIDDGLLKEIRTPYEVFRQEDNRVMLYLHFGMSNDLSRQISANVRRGNRQKYERGEYVGKAPLGYLNVAVGIHHNISIDPDKGPLVKKLFLEFSTGGYSVQDMVRKADNWGLRSVFGHRIAKSGMYTLLRRAAYYGVYKHGGEYHKGSYEALITKGLFDRVQEVLRDRGKPRKNGWLHPYKGIVKCPECGCLITATTKIKYYKKTGRTATYTYYHCTKRRGKCFQKPITEMEMEAMMRGYISKIEIDKKVWDLGVELLKAKHSDEVDRGIQIKARLMAEKNKVDKDMEKLLKMRMDEEISSDEYAKAKAVLLDNKVNIDEKLTDQEHSSDTWLELAENFFETCFQARELMESGDFEKKRELVRTVGWNLYLKDKNLEFSFRKPFDILLQPSIRSNMQGWRESNPR